MSERELDLEKTYLLKHTTQMVRVQIDELLHRTDMDTLENVEASTLGLNEIGRARLQCHRALCFR